ncbi:DEKNAAC104523 [Brettanomyces naardenensis]|uniref:DEKNAAC104523 n=1 Tax=Brettanomyces naardenensis TaxID=13370 RepID=A0A448YRL2_BRENA|nr:DEKNAAC104523 [Brettanomyces naardenensis]
MFKSPLDIELRLDGEDTRETVEVKSTKGRKEKIPLYKDGETVKGQVTIRMRDNKRVEHTGIKIQLLGTIEMNNDGVQSDDFVSLAHELASPGELRHPETFPFEFRNVEKPYESYRGLNVRLKYYLKVTVSRKSADVIREKELWVYQYQNQAQVEETTGDKKPMPTSMVKMDVGIENCLHIEFEYSKNRYSLKDVIVGRIYFLLVRLKIKHMELSLIRRETCGAPPSQKSESQTIVRFEIMDGAPVRGETIPIRLFLGGFDLTPTYKDVNKKFSTRTFLSLVLIDEDARRYFKQSEIILYRDE